MTSGGASGVSKDGKIAYATIQYDVQTNELDKASTERIIKVAQGADNGSELEVQLGGQAITEAEEESGDASFAIGLLAAIVILLIAFGSVVAMGLPIITALFALGVGISLVTIGTHVVDTANFAPVLAAMIGLGVGIDYALFIVTRFRNNLDEGDEPQEAAVRAVDTAGRAVLFAGTTVIIALMGMFLLNITFLYGVAVAAALAVLFTMISSLTLLPAMLAGVGHRINKWKIPGLSRRPEHGPRRHHVVPLEPLDPAQPVARRDPLRRLPARSSASRPCRCASASTTPAPTRPGRRPARPTTCSPKASAPASTGR